MSDKRDTHSTAQHSTDSVCTSVWKELGVDLLESFLVHHTTGTLLHRGEVGVGGGCREKQGEDAEDAEESSRSQIDQPKVCDKLMKAVVPMQLKPTAVANYDHLSVVALLSQV